MTLDLFLIKRIRSTKTRHALYSIHEYITTSRIMKFITCKKVFKYKGDGQYVPGDVTHVRFDQSVREVDGDAFRNCLYLMEVVFNEGLQKIGNNAFFQCVEPIDITFPSSIIEIGDSAFHFCTHTKIRMRLCLTKD